MLSREWQFKQSYAEVVSAFQEAFPGVKPPASEWIFLWINKYSTVAIAAAIQTLSQHPLKAQFTTASCGRAISSLLRTDALKRAQAAILQKSAVRP